MMKFVTHNSLGIVTYVQKSVHHQVRMEWLVIPQKVNMYFQLYMITIMTTSKIIVDCCLSKIRALASQRETFFLRTKVMHSYKQVTSKIKTGHCRPKTSISAQIRNNSKPNFFYRVQTFNTMFVRK